jgi:hypothetical protein
VVVVANDFTINDTPQFRVKKKLRKPKPVEIDKIYSAITTGISFAAIPTLLPTGEVVEVDNLGRLSKVAEERILAGIDEMRLFGYSPVTIHEKVGRNIDEVHKKLQLLEKRDSEDAGKDKGRARKREIDLQYLQIIKQMKTMADQTLEDETKIECYKIIRDTVGLRAKLWGVDKGDTTSDRAIKMGNVETVMIGGDLNKQTFNLIADIIAGKTKPKEFIEGEVISQKEGIPTNGGNGTGETSRTRHLESQASAFKKD